MQVYYDPRRPERAVLQAGIQRGTIVGLLVSLVVLAMTVYLFVRS